MSTYTVSFTCRMLYDDTIKANKISVLQKATSFQEVDDGIYLAANSFTVGTTKSLFSNITEKNTNWKNNINVWKDNSDFTDLSNLLKTATKTRTVTTTYAVSSTWADAEKDPSFQNTSGVFTDTSKGVVKCITTDTYSTMPTTMTGYLVLNCKCTKSDDSYDTYSTFNLSDYNSLVPVRPGYHYDNWYVACYKKEYNKDSSFDTYFGNGQYSYIYPVWIANEISLNDYSKELTCSPSSIQSFTDNPTATNGTGSYTYSIISGNDSNYFNINSGNGNLSISSNAHKGIYNLTVKAVDNKSAKEATATWTITLNPAANTIVSITPSSDQKITYNGNNQNVSTTIKISGGGNVYVGISTSNSIEPTTWTLCTNIGDNNYQGTTTVKDIGAYYIWIKVTSDYYADIVPASCYKLDIVSAMKVYTADGWQYSKAVKVYNGSTWVEAKEIKVYDGSKWVEAK